MTERTTRLQRVRERLFANIPTFDTKEKWFAPMPMLLRTVLGSFRAREWQALSWIYMNCRREGLCAFSLEELGSALQFKSKPKLREMLRDLERRHWIVRAEEHGTEYYLIRNPLDAIRANVRSGKIAGKTLDAVNDFLVSYLKTEPLEPPAPTKGSVP